MGVKHDENDGIENKQEQSQQSQPDVKAETTVNTIISTQQTLRGDLNPRWWLNLSPIILCRQLRRVFRLDISEFDNPQ